MIAEAGEYEEVRTEILNCSFSIFLILCASAVNPFGIKTFIVCFPFIASKHLATLIAIVLTVAKHVAQEHHLCCCMAFVKICPFGKA